MNEIEANPFQPRKEFDEDALEELANSIRLHGLVQPVTVRKMGYGKYELISGERRTRAAIRAGLKTIPAYVRVANDQGMLEMALIENIHRENLNAIEIAVSYKRLQEECKLGQEELGERVGKNRTTVTNYLRLLRLPEEIQIALRDNQITMGHARALITMEDRDAQLLILDDIIDHDLSVRQVEELVKTNGKPTNGKAKKAAKIIPGNIQIWEKTFSGLLDKKVKIKMKPNGKGEIMIPFQSENDIKSLVAILEKN